MSVEISRASCSKGNLISLLQLHASMLKYGVAQKSVNRNKSFVLKGMFRLRLVNSGMSQLHALFRIQLL
jgi:hypothetical protein